MRMSLPKYVCIYIMFILLKVVHTGVDRRLHSRLQSSSVSGCLCNRDFECMPSRILETASWMAIYPARRFAVLIP